MLLDDFDELVCAEGGEEPVRALLTACQLNAAQCALKREEWFAQRDASPSRQRTKEVSAVPAPLRSGMLLGRRGMRWNESCLAARGRKWLPDDTQPSRERGDFFTLRQR